MALVGPFAAECLALAFVLPRFLIHLLFVGRDLGDDVPVDAGMAALAIFHLLFFGGEEGRASDIVRAALAATAAACRRPRQNRWTPPELGEPGAGSRHFSFVSSNIPIVDRSVVAAATGAERLWRGVVQSVTW